MRQDNFTAARAELETFGLASVGISAIDYNHDGGSQERADRWREAFGETVSGLVAEPSRLERMIFRAGPKAYEVGVIEQTIRSVPAASHRAALVARFRPRRLEAYPHLRDVLGELATIAPMVPAAWDLCAGELEPIGCEDPRCDCASEVARTIAPDVTPTLERLNARARGTGILRVREQAGELLQAALAAYDAKRIERIRVAAAERQRREDREIEALIAREREALGLAVA